MPARVMISLKKTSMSRTAMPATKVALLHSSYAPSPKLVRLETVNLTGGTSLSHSSVYLNSRCCQPPWDFTEDVPGVAAVSVAACPLGAKTSVTVGTLSLA